MAAPWIPLDARHASAPHPEALPARDLPLGDLRQEEARAWGTLTEAVLARMAVGPTDRVLELGCGSGGTLFHVARRAPRGLVVGVDASDAMLRRARMRDADLVGAGRVRLELGTCSNLSAFAPGGFDRVYAVHEVYFWSDPRAELGEVRRVLRPGGQLLLGFRPTDDERGGARDLSRYPARRMEWLLREKGFGPVRSERVGKGPAEMVWLSAQR
jgi:SAM-dependent methyltransferase